MSSFRLAEMTTEQAAAAVAESPLVLLPAGAFEQHGPGMPLATDLVRAEHVAQRVATELGGQAVIGPSLPVGVSPHHMNFAGTITLSTTTFAAVLRECATSLHRHGWRRILVITGHGGNNATLTAVAQDLLTTHEDLQFAWTPLTALASDVVSELDVSEVHGHSGEAETAQMLFFAPHLVHLDRLVPGTTRRAELDATGAATLRPGPPKLTSPYDRLSRNGVLGDPRRATADQGAAIADAMTRRITDFAAEWLKTG